MLRLTLRVTLASLPGDRLKGHCTFWDDMLIQVNSLWFKLFIYSITGCGPPSLLLVKGTKLRRLPDVFDVSSRLVMSLVCGLVLF